MAGVVAHALLCLVSLVVAVPGFLLLSKLVGVAVHPCLCRGLPCVTLVPQSLRNLSIRMADPCVLQSIRHHVC